MGDWRSKIFALLKALIIGLISLLAVLVAAVLILAQLGTKKDYFRCHGEFVESEEATKGVIFLEFVRYRSWLFWADSAGTMWAEVPNGTMVVYHDIKDIGRVYSIHGDGYRPGVFSPLSQGVSIDLGRPTGEFVGACESVER